MINPLGSSVLLVAFVGACTPSLSVTPFIDTAPTVKELENHVTCVLARELDNHSEDSSWQNLIKYNFVSVMNFTLFVNQTEGLNPSFNFITPLTNLGNPIVKTIESSNGVTNPMNATTNTNNFTLAVGFQLDGSQDANFVFNYLVGLPQIFYKRQEILSGCDAGAGGFLGGSLRYGLKGDLMLKETLTSGLAALQANEFYPANLGQELKQTQQPSTAAAGQSAGGTPNFSSKIDFNLLWGVNGGPNWTLLTFKGPGGGSAGGGGGMGAGGGGGGGGMGAGGGGGGGGQLINYSRSKQDTLIATFVATCRSEGHPIDLSGTEKLPASPQQQVIEGKIKLKRPDLPHISTGTYQLFVNGDLSKSGAFGDDKGAIIITTDYDPTVQPNQPKRVRGDAKVAWVGFIYNDLYGHKSSISLRGTITDPLPELLKVASFHSPPISRHIKAQKLRNQPCLLRTYMEN
jgi:hypothetical protein